MLFPHLSLIIITFLPLIIKAQQQPQPCIATCVYTTLSTLRSNRQNQIAQAPGDSPDNTLLPLTDAEACQLEEGQQTFEQCLPWERCTVLSVPK
ncbi:hypothetical protein HK097_009556, partial [Rhizophlyctis rosea]